MQGAVVNPNSEPRTSRRITETARAALGVNDGQFASFKDSSKELRKQHFCPQIYLEQ